MTRCQLELHDKNFTYIGDHLLRLHAKHFDCYENRIATFPDYHHCTLTRQHEHSLR